MYVAAAFLDLNCLTFPQVNFVIVSLIFVFACVVRIFCNVFVLGLISSTGLHRWGIDEHTPHGQIWIWQGKKPIAQCTPDPIVA